MTSHRSVLIATLAILGTFGAAVGTAESAVTVSGVVGSSAKYLVTGLPVTGSAPAVFKITFENRTSGTNLALCAGSMADFQSGTCALPLATSGGPGFRFLTIVDMATLSGKVLFVKRAVGTAASTFVLVVE